MRTFNFEQSFNRRLAFVVVTTLLLLITLTSRLNVAPLQSAFAGESRIEVAIHR
jgi:hypothetical protein